MTSRRATVRLYAASPGRRTLQVAADLLAVTWVVLAVWVGTQVDDGVDAVAQEVGRVEVAGDSLGGGLADAGGVLDGAPVVGDEIASPFDRAAESSADLGRAGAEAASDLDVLGTWLGVGAAVVLLLVALPWWLPHRVRFVVTATLLERHLVRGGDPDLLALRAIARQPLARLLRRHPDAAAAWRRGDPEVVDALARLEARGAGLPAPAGVARDAR